MIHVVKCKHTYFEQVVTGAKKFEVRNNDRNYQPGDIFIMQEIEDKTGLIRRFEQMRVHLASIQTAVDGIKTLNYRQFEDARLTELTDRIESLVMQNTAVGMVIAYAEDDMLMLPFDQIQQLFRGGGDGVEVAVVGEHLQGIVPAGGQPLGKFCRVLGIFDEQIRPDGSIELMLHRHVQNAPAQVDDGHKLLHHLLGPVADEEDALGLGGAGGVGS